MTTDPASAPAAPANQFAYLTALLTMFVCAAVLVGWVFDITVLKSILPIWVSMKANTAVCFLLSGFQLLMVVGPPAIFKQRFTPALLRLARICGWLVGLIGLCTLSEYIFGWDLGIDQWLIRDDISAMGTSNPGRMAPEAALDFMLLTVTLSVIESGKIKRTLLAVTIGLTMTAFSLAALLSYAMPGLGSFGWFGLTAMAMNTATLFTLLGLSIVLFSLQRETLEWSLGIRTTLALACGMMLLVFIGLNTSRSQYLRAEVNAQIAYQEQVIKGMTDLTLETIDAQAHARGYIITGEDQYLAEFLEEKEYSAEQKDLLRKLITGHPEQQQEFSRIATNVDDLLLWMDQSIKAERVSSNVAARNTMFAHGETLLENLHDESRLIHKEHEQRIQQLKLEVDRITLHTYFIIFGGTLTSLIIFLLVIFNLNFAVTRSVQNRLAMQISERKYSILFESSSDAILLLDKQGIFDCNPAALQMFGYSAQSDILGKHPSLISPLTQPGGENSMELANQHLALAFKTGSEQFEWVCRRQDGSEFPAGVKLTAMQLDGKKILQVTVHDNTVRKNAEEKIKQQLDYLERFQKVAVKREFRIKELTDELDKLRAGMDIKHE